MVSRYKHDPHRGHWEVAKQILRYIKGTIDIDLVFEKDTIGKKECIRYVDSNYTGSRQASAYNGICIYIVPITGKLTVYFYNLLSLCLPRRPSIWS